MNFRYPGDNRHRRKFNMTLGFESILRKRWYGLDFIYFFFPQGRPHCVGNLTSTALHQILDNLPPNTVWHRNDHEQHNSFLYFFCFTFPCTHYVCVYCGTRPWRFIVGYSDIQYIPAVVNTSKQYKWGAKKTLQV